MSKEKTNTYHYGFAIVRTFMCFIVVTCHFWSTEAPVWLRPLSMLKPFAVPVFMFLSFYLSHGLIMGRDTTRALRRLRRLLLPQIGWAIIYFVVYWVLGALLHKELVTGISDLFWQMLTGHSESLNPTMWFQTDLIILTVLFFGVFRFLSEKTGTLVLCGLSLLCLVGQYSGMNYAVFSGMRFELAYPLGRVAETLPIAALGLFAARWNLLTFRKARSLPVALGAFVLSWVFVVADRQLPLTGVDTFGYAGIWKMLYAFSVTVFAYGIDLSRLSDKAKKTVGFLTDYTLGIYCGHRLVAFFVLNIFEDVLGLSAGQLYICVLIYALNHFACWVVNKLPFAWIRDLV